MISGTPNFYIYSFNSDIQSSTRRLDTYKKAGSLNLMPYISPELFNKLNASSASLCSAC